MTGKRFELRLCSNGLYYLWCNNELSDIYFDKFNKECANELVECLNTLNDENEKLKQENKKLHTKIFEMRTNIALERTEISSETYTAKEFLDELEKW